MVVCAPEHFRSTTTLLLLLSCTDDGRVSFGCKAPSSSPTNYRASRQHVFPVFLVSFSSIKNKMLLFVDVVVVIWIGGRVREYGTSVG